MSLVAALAMALTLRSGVAPAAQAPAQPQTPQQTTGVAVATDYQLDEGDSVGLFVYNHPEFSGTFLVPSGGVVEFPVAGSVKVTGLTIDELSRRLKIAYRKELKNPVVSVSLVSVRPQQMTVMGDVQKGGVVPIVPGLKLANAISAAGGLIPDVKSSDCTITLLPRVGSPRSFPLDEVLSGSPESNITLQNGDTVQVDAGMFPVFVIGQVKVPGLQHMNRGGGILQAIASAGGVSDGAAISRVRLTHLSGKDEVVDLVPSLLHGETASKLPTLSKGDLITVPQVTDQIAVLGYVGLPGVFPIPDGTTYHLSDAVSLAKGQDPQRRGSFTKVVIARKVDGKPTHNVYNLGKYLKNGDDTQNPVLYAGDVVYVPETNAAPSSSILAAIASLGIFYNAVK